MGTQLRPARLTSRMKVEREQNMKNQTQNLETQILAAAAARNVQAKEDYYQVNA